MEGLPSGSEDFKMYIMNKLVKDDIGKLAMEDKMIAFYAQRKWNDIHQAEVES